MSRIYTRDEALDRLKGLACWSLDEGEITRTFEFGGFVEALVFVNRVAELSEQVQHHPDVDIRYNKVRLGLMSHDVSGLTDRDFDLAAKINDLR